MKSYHIKDDGTPGLCKARRKPCPKGGQHFTSEEDARAAVELLFGSSFQGVNEPLATYTKKAIREQFSGIKDYAGAPLAVRLASHVNEVERILLASRLDVREQNLKAKEAIEASLEEIAGIRNDQAGSVEERIDAAMSQHVLSPVLAEHYNMVDARTPAQVKADQAYAENWVHPASDVAYGGEPFTLNGSSDSELVALSKFAGSDHQSFTHDELEIIQSLNPQAREGRFYGTADPETKLPLEDYDEARELLAESIKVSPIMQAHLKGHARPEALRARMDRAVKEITMLAPIRFGSLAPRVDEEGVNLFDAAKVTLYRRKANKTLTDAVLNA